MKYVCLVFLLCAAFFCSDCLADDNFIVNTIAYEAGDETSVAVDMNNTPIAVSGDYWRDLMLIRQTPNGYDVNFIPDSSGGRYPKLKITSNNELALLFLKAGQLWYGSKSDWFDWFFSQVASNTSLVYADMALTSNDIPHLVYVGSDPEYVEHSFFDVHSQQWSTESLAGFGTYSIGCLDIDIDSVGRILIGCSDRGGITRCVVYSDGFWNYLATIEQTDFSDSGFAADGLPAVAYTRQEMLYYAVYINDIIGWVETEIAPAQAVGHRRFSLAHSSTGVPGIAYIDDNKLMYATNIAGGWTTTQIDKKGSYPDLIFDHNDKPLIVYGSYDECIGTEVTKLAGIGLEPFNAADLNNDKIVNFQDFAVMAEYWMAQSSPPDFLAGDLNKDSFVNNMDLKWLGCNWLWQGSGN